MILYHYTNQAGHDAILKSKKLKPSLKAHNPKDARYGDGQYLTDVEPHTKRPGQLSHLFLVLPYFGRRFTHFIGIRVDGLSYVKGRDHVFVVLNSKDLDLSERIVSNGRN